MFKKIRTTLIAAGLVAAALPAADASASQIVGYSSAKPVEIVNLSSGLRADVMWGSQNSAQGVFLWKNNTSPSQEFNVLPSGNGYFRLQARHSKQCLMLDWRSGSYRNSTPIVQHAGGCRAGYAPGEWRFGTVDAGVNCDGDVCSTSSAIAPILVNRKTGKCLDAYNGNGVAPPMQTILVQHDCIRSIDAPNAENQMFALRNVR